ncbi:hypothetical protein RDABS01_031441 [Bienertia sinuspersici]
MRSNCFTTL